MDNTIKIDKIITNKNRIEYILDVKGEVCRYFNLEEQMFIEYMDDIEAVPEGILVIPLLTNILPIAWYTNSKIIVNELDKTFYKCIDNIKRGYMDMHTKVKMQGEVIVKALVDYSYTPTEKSATFFSGGVDSLATYITRESEKPTLVTLWGADIDLNDALGWNKVKTEIETFANRKQVPYLFIKSGFRKFINYDELNKEFMPLMNDGWWHGAQHGIGLIGHIAPYAYINKMKIMYIPSTYTKEDGHISSASYPTIDNQVKFAACSVLHEGFENTRQDKIKIIANYIKNIDSDLFIRVCWQSDGGINCGKCEKCARTIMALISEKMDPNKCGFIVNRDTLKAIEYNIKNEWIIPEEFIHAYWGVIQENYNCDKNFWMPYEELKWILDIDLRLYNKKKKSIISKIRRRIRKGLRGYIHE